MSFCVRFWAVVLAGAGMVGYVLAAEVAAPAAAPTTVTPASAATPLRPILRAPPPVYSRDNAFVILASGENADYRLPVLQFADELRRVLSRALDVPLGMPESPVTLVISNVPGETGAVCKRVRDVTGNWREQVEMGDPERVDLDVLRVALLRALLRAWLAVAAEPGSTPTEPPDWFLRGLVRTTQRSERQPDLEKVLMLWSHGRLPPVPDLLAADPPDAMREPALSAVLVAWMSERDSGAARMRALLTHLASGGAWSADALLPILRPAGDIAHVDEDWDRWLTAKGRSVLEPGVTTAGVLRRFRQQLVVFPADFDVPLAEGWRARPLVELLPYAAAPWMAQLATAKASQVRLAALGRDGALYAVAEAYAGFFDALARQEPAGVLQMRLQSADRLLTAAEAATAAGQTLREPVPSAPRSKP